MTYEDAFRAAVMDNIATGQRIKIYREIWNGDYFASRYILPVPPYWAVLIGEVGRRTPR
ncbi:hypothetical protein [Paramagnetospirillum kuznetsovii]|uniref:hypothetical protein n=1 Tax=Paramagnetospirillum kuznetsovii TaxID=2053833 RepID=UPI001374D913|nr:hypothetical protein [Paramagnetospirillum kuznetsovii]